jgi:hypothetical protein
VLLTPEEFSALAMTSMALLRGVKAFPYNGWQAIRTIEAKIIMERTTVESTDFRLNHLITRKNSRIGEMSLRILRDAMIKMSDVSDENPFEVG